MNEIRWAVSQSAIAVMILVALFTVCCPWGWGCGSGDAREAGGGFSCWAR